MATCPLNDDELHLWFVRFDELFDADHGQAPAPLLDETELARAGRFLFDRDRRTYTLSHMLVRTMLSAFTGVDPAAWRFESNAHGKPRISEPAGYAWLRFNLSHTRGGALCGVARDVEVGVDIETLDRATECVGLAERYFSPLETAALRRAPAERQKELFFRFWTLKEAYIKARGLGLSIPLDHFSFELDAARTPTISFTPEIDDSPAHWQFAEVDCGPGLPAAIALARGTSSDRRIVSRRITRLFEV
ncbi:MAG: 4'-phosphopantetheinyl transferase superfamily protein [Planctomycetia bacterium]|nr:4'-phosphopantetheinyl transferase superfamily protein [Planctomycetia bacterium]